jgi:acetyltransferase-like isoleucine patch superfamily enzyme
MPDLLPPLPAVVVPPAVRPSAAKAVAKAALHGLATAAVLPWLVCYRLVAAFVGRDRALEGATQALACLPGLSGVYLRRAFLARVLARCDRSAEVSFGTLFSQAGAVIEAGVYVGPRCHLGLVHLERDVLVAAGVHVPSGGRTHFAEDPAVPIKDQGGERRVVRIGAGAWVGSAAVVLADVGRGTIVGAGSVVTRPLPDGVIAAGVPAKVIRPRFARGPGILDEGTS